MAGLASALESRLPIAPAPAEAGAAGGKGLVSLFDATLSGLMPVASPPGEMMPAQPVLPASSLSPQPAATALPAAAADAVTTLPAPETPATPDMAAGPVRVAPRHATSQPAIMPPAESPQPLPAQAGTAAAPATLKARMNAALAAEARQPLPAAEPETDDTAPAASASLPDITQALPPAQLPPLSSAESRLPVMPRVALADGVPAALRSIRADSADAAEAAAVNGPRPAPQLAVPPATPAAGTSQSATVFAAARAGTEPAFSREMGSVVASLAPRIADKPAVTGSGAATAADVAPQIMPNQSGELPRLVAAGSQPAVALTHTPLQDPAWAQAAGQRLAWMVQGGESTAVLAINPESLGPIHVRIHMDGQAARIDLAAQQPMTMTLMESHLPRLTAALESHGVRVDELRIGHQPLAGDFSAGQGAFAGSGQQAAAGEQGARQPRWLATAASVGAGRTAHADAATVAVPAQTARDGRVDDFA